ncbi:hypothetical protein ABQE45_18010 [Mycobacteroides chelonae]
MVSLALINPLPDASAAPLVPDIDSLIDDSGPLPSSPADLNAVPTLWFSVIVSAEGSWATWSATQARAFWSPDRLFDASKYGGPLQAGNAISAGGGQCSLSQASVLECRKGESGFAIDSAGIRIY